MKILLTGHPYSKMIIPASSWLWKKYSPKSFRIQYLNFGNYDGVIYRGEYIKLADEQVGGKGAWGTYIYNYVKTLRDKYVILGCDDFLINSKIDMKRYRELKSLLGGNTVSARLCDITWYPSKDYNCGSDGIASLRKGAPYSCTGQLTIWDRKALLELLDCGDIWGFESHGSQVMEQRDWGVVASYDPPFKYHTISALSGGDNRIDLGGLNDEDKEYIINNLITEGNVK